MDKLQEARKIIDKVDTEMAQLFARRMEAVETVAAYKRDHGLPIFDSAREEEVIRNGEARMERQELRRHYGDFLRSTMTISRNYQQELLQPTAAFCGYPITIQRGALHHTENYMNLNRKVLLVTDSGVPAAYAETIAERCAAPTVVTLPQGEGS